VREVTVRGTRRQRKSLVVLVGDGQTSDSGAQALSTSLQSAGIETVYMGRPHDAREIATSAADLDADAVEVCLAGAGGVFILRELLRELRRLGRHQVAIVVHRVQ